MVIAIKYQLNKPGKDYTQLYSAIESLGSYVRDPSLHTLWFVATNKTVQQVDEEIRQQIDPNDHLFVTRLHFGEYAGWLSKDIWAWIGANV
jgi:hypothetical protein